MTIGITPRDRRAASTFVVATGLVLFGVTHAASAQAVPEPPPSSAAPTDEALLDRWLSASAEVQGWRTQIGSARFDVVSARLFPNPQLAVSGYGTPLGTPTSGVGGYAVQLTFPVPMSGQLPARTDAATAALRVTEVQVLAQMWQRAADIEDAIVDRAFAQARLEQADEGLREIASVESVVRARVQAGANGAYDVTRVTTAASTLRANRAQAEIDRDRAEAQILALIGDPSLRFAPVTLTSIAGYAGPAREDELVSAALERRPDLELAHRGVAANELLARRYRAEAQPVPSFSIGAAVTHVPESGTLQIGLSLPLPAFDRNQGLIGRALSDADGQRRIEEALRNRIRAEVSGAWRTREQARAALDRFQRDGLEGNADLLRVAQVRYQAGMANILDLVDALRTVWEARGQALELRRTLAQAEADLGRATALVLPTGTGRATSSR